MKILNLQIIKRFFVFIFIGSLLSQGTLCEERNTLLSEEDAIKLAQAWERVEKSLNTLRAPREDAPFSDDPSNPVSPFDSADLDVIRRCVCLIKNRLRSHDDFVRPKLCEILDNLRKDECCPCDFFITQADIPIIIREPGVYCLTESVTLSEDIAITISAVNDVVLDMWDHVIDGKGGAINGISVIEDCSNIEIKDGTVKNLYSDCIFIENANCVKIENIKTAFSSDNGINIVSTSTLQVKNCQSLNNPGHGFQIDCCNNLIVKNCVSSSNGDHGIFMFEVDNSCFINVKAQSNGVDGFRINSSSNNIFISCIAQDNFNMGFEIISCDNSILKMCTTERNVNDGFIISGNIAKRNYEFIGCSAIDNSGTGFDIILDNCTMRECIANNNDDDGFNITGTNCNMRECTANDNGDDGFEITGNNCIMRECVSTNNSTDGFKISSDDCELRNSSAANNGSAGIRGTGADRLELCNNLVHGNAIGFDLINAEDTDLCKALKVLGPCTSSIVETLTVDCVTKEDINSTCTNVISLLKTILSELRGHNDICP